MARSWYAYDGVGNKFALSSYSLATDQPACPGGFNLCAIYAPSGGTNPQFISNNIRNYINNGLVKGTNQPSLPVGSRIYVVLRPNT